MLIQFATQILIGFRTYGEGEIVDFPDDAASNLIDRGIARAIEAPPVREAVNPAVHRARKATKRGRHETRNR